MDRMLELVTPVDSGANNSDDVNAAIQQRLQQKVQKVQKEVPAWIQRTGNQAKVDPLLQRLDQYIKEPNPREAERVADEILELIESE